MSYTFSQLANYGVYENSLAEEVQTDLQLKCDELFGSFTFNRNDGVGLSLFENETFDTAGVSFLKAQIATNLASYNDTASPEKQIIVSQELIQIDFDSTGVLVILAYVYLLKDLMNPAANPIQVGNI